MDTTLLDKLNTYLISKGKPPKKLHQNFLKANVDSVKRFSFNNDKKCIKKETASVSLHDRFPIKSRENTSLSFGKTSNQYCQKENVSRFVKKTPIRKPIKSICSTKLTNHANFSTSSKHPGQNKNTPKFVKKTPSKKPSKLIGITKPGNHASKKEENKVQAQLAEAAKKKLLRRSMNSSFKTRRTSKLGKSFQNHLKATPKHSSNGKLTVNTEKILRKKLCVPEKKIETPKQKRIASNKEKQQRLEQLRSWMIAKGKDPSNLCGFKPAKTVLTPVNSPAKYTSATSGQWPTLREEDFCDELSILINQTMREAQSCLEKDCSPLEVHSQLIAFKKNVPIAEKYASFWITLSQVYQKLNKDKNDIIKLFETAIEFKAQPENHIKTALKDFVENKLTESPPKSLSTSNKERLNLPLNKTDSITLSSPATSLSSFGIFGFKTIPVSPLVTGESPSSMVRLRMVPRSSPIFKKMVSRKALPVDVNAIVTPVRRSKRIESLKWSYPKGLVSKETCVSNPSELVKTLQSNKETSGDFIFEPNSALGDDFSDIQKVLKFE